MPESQRWLAKTNNEEKCLKVLESIYKEDHVKKEEDALKDEIMNMKSAIEMKESERLK